MLDNEFEMICLGFNLACLMVLLAILATGSGLDMLRKLRWSRRSDGTDQDDFSFLSLDYLLFRRPKEHASDLMPPSPVERYTNSGHPQRYHEEQRAQRDKVKHKVRLVPAFRADGRSQRHILRNRHRPGPSQRNRSRSKWLFWIGVPSRGRHRRPLRRSRLARQSRNQKAPSRTPLTSSTHTKSVRLFHSTMFPEGKQDEKEGGEVGGM